MAHCIAAKEDWQETCLLSAEKRFHSTTNRYFGMIYLNENLHSVFPVLILFKAWLPKKGEMCAVLIWIDNIAENSQEGEYEILTKMLLLYSPSLFKLD